MDVAAVAFIMQHSIQQPLHQDLQHGTGMHDAWQKHILCWQRTIQSPQTAAILFKQQMPQPHLSKATSRVEE
jgi:hypothetical protein